MSEASQANEASAGSDGRGLVSTTSSVKLAGEIGAVVLFCSFFSFLVWSQARSTSATFDETVHLPAGYSYLLLADYRMNPEHPPLVKKWAALPLRQMSIWPPKEALAGTAAAQPPPRNLLKLQWNWALAWVDPVASELNFGHSLLYSIRAEKLKATGVSDPSDIPGTIVLAKGDFENDADQLLLRSRMMIMVLGILLGVLVYCWAREWFGVAGGVLALALFCFDPNFIAHSGLVTTDVGAATFMFGAVYFLWRTCRRLNALNVVMTVLFFALAFVTKFTAVLLVPIFFFIGLCQVFSPNNWPIGAKRFLASRLQKFLAFSGLMLTCAVATFVMIWACYSFRFTVEPDLAHSVRSAKIRLSETALATAGATFMRRGADESSDAYLARLMVRLREIHPSAAALLETIDGHLPIGPVVQVAAVREEVLKDWDWQRRPAGPTGDDLKAAAPNAPVPFSGRVILLAQRHHWLPEAYLYGLAFADLKSQVRGSFLLGQYSNEGFWYYFPVAFLLKTPLTTLAAILLGLFYALRRRLAWGSQLGFIVIPVGIYLLFSMTSHLNIGQRHLLPIYPFLFVLSGAVVLPWSRWELSRRVWTAALVLGLVALSSSIVLAPPWKPAVIYPHYLAYFNEFAGGPRNGYKCLVDSNLDWGQDLKGLKAWLDRNQIKEPIHLCYFGMADPRFYQIRYYDTPRILGNNSWENSRYDALSPEDSIKVFLDDLRPNEYLAVSATAFTGIYLPAELQDFWPRLLAEATYVDCIGYSIFIYRLPGPP